MAQTRREKNPADRIFRIRMRERVHFSDLSERRALKLTSLPRYASRAHFNLWARQFGGLDLKHAERPYTPLVHVDLESIDRELEPNARIGVRGETRFSRTLLENGETRNLARDGRYAIHREDGELLGRVRMVNFFAHNDPSPRRRRVTRLPAWMGLGEGPSRVLEIPALRELAPRDRAPDFMDREERRWHYAQTDPNRHVSAVEYIRTLEEYVSQELACRGLDLRTFYPRRVRISYRKPCFRGECYRRVGWWHGDSPAAVSLCIARQGDDVMRSPAVAVEFELDQHRLASADAISSREDESSSRLP